MRTLCDESKEKLLTPLRQWSLENNKYITTWKWFYPAIYTHFTIEDTKHGANIDDGPTKHAGTLKY